MSKIGSCMVVGLMSLQLYHVSSVDAAEEFVPGQTAIQQLHSLKGQHVGVVLTDQAGVRGVIYARVNPKLTRKDVIYFDQFVKRLPEAEMTLIEKFVSEKLKHPITTEIGKETVRRLNGGSRVRKIRAAGQTVENGRDQYLVQSIERLSLTGPDVTSRFTMTSRTVPGSDRWIGHRAGQKSNQEIVYRLVHSDNEYRFRLLWNENPNFYTISSVEISQPGYFYYSENKYERGIEFFVTYIRKDNGRHRRTYRGVVELDTEGYPTRGNFARAPFLDKALFSEVGLAKEASKPLEPEFAGKLPAELRRNHHDGGSLPPSSTLSQSKERRKKVVGPIELNHLPTITADEGQTPAEMTESESAQAAYLEGLKYFKQQNYPEAIKWYRKAAEQGDATAQLFLGLCYHDGTGVQQSAVEAVKWYRKAAEHGDATAQRKLGACYQDGTGIEQSVVEAVMWYIKAAEQGDATAQFNLGVCYRDGTGVEQSAIEAVKWYRKAAEQGDARAQCNLGVCYFRGTGVEQSAVEAVKWYRKAAKQGDAKAQNNLGGGLQIWFWG